jgi:uroporphyrinogen decarboxylase
LSSSIERVRAALELREPDRVPAFDLMNELRLDNEVLGKKASPLGPLLQNPSVSKVADRLLPRFKNQFRFVDIAARQFSILGAAAAVKMGYDSAWIPYLPFTRLDDSKTLVDLFGRVSDVFIDEYGNIGNPIYREGLIKSPADWAAWDKRLIFNHPVKVNEVFKSVQARYGDRLYIFGFSTYGLFETTWQPMGFERFVVAVRRDRDFIRSLIKFYEDLFCELLEAKADAGIPAAVYTDDLAFRSGPMLSPRLIDELFGDSYRRITETAHALGMKILMHACGNTYDLLEWFADCGFDAVHPLEPTAGMELAKVKEMVGDRICIIGNIDVSHILVDGTRAEVFEAVRKAIGDAGRGGGFILGPDHSHPKVSVERLRWMVEACGKYGHYPLKLDEAA